MVDCIVTTTGGIEEDFIKCTSKFYIGDYNLDGPDLFARGVYRIGNMMAQNAWYNDFEGLMIPLIKEMHEEQKEKGTIFTPSKIINKMGEAVNNEESVYYWCWKNDIPVFCPAFSDGACGDNLFYYNYSNPGFIVDYVQDMSKIIELTLKSKKRGMILCGGGVSKHHICNANAFKKGADYSVYINTGLEYDCSDTGASPSEAVTWEKININAECAKINADFSIILPLLVSQTFAKHEKLASRV